MPALALVALEGDRQGGWVPVRIGPHVNWRQLVVVREYGGPGTFPPAAALARCVALSPPLGPTGVSAPRTDAPVLPLEGGLVVGVSPPTGLAALATPQALPAVRAGGLWALRAVP
jgi:hypothetical protein